MWYVAIKKVLIVIIAVFSSASQCSLNILLPGARASIVADCLKVRGSDNTNAAKDLALIVESYVFPDSCLEAASEKYSEKYRAYLHKPDSWGGHVVLYVAEGPDGKEAQRLKEVQRFKVRYPRAVAISPQKDLLLVIHKEQKNWHSRYSLALTAFAIDDKISSTEWIAWQTKKNYQPSEVNPSLPLQEEECYFSYIQLWPDISSMRIKKLCVESGSAQFPFNITVELYDQVRFPSCGECRYLSCQSTCKLMEQFFMLRARNAILEKRSVENHWAIAHPYLHRIKKYLQNGLCC